MQRILVPARTLLANHDLVVVLVCSALLGLAYSFVGPFMSMFGTIEVGMSEWAFGIFMTATALSAIAATTALARWSDTHWSRRTVLIIGSVCGALGYVGYALVRDVPWLLAIGCTVLAVSTISFSQLFAHAREVLAKSHVPQSETPLYMNVFRLFFALSWTVGPAIAAWVLRIYSYRGAFLTAAGLFVVLLGVVLWRIPHDPPPAANRMVPKVPLRVALAQPGLLAYFTGLSLIAACVTMGMQNLPLLVLNTLGGDLHHVGIIYSVAPVFELPFMFYFGWKASRGDQGQIMRTGALIAIVYYALLAFVGAPWHVYPLQILSAAMIAVISGVAITFFQDYLPGQMGSATNLYSTSQRIGSTGGYLVFGVLAHKLGYRAVFVVCSGLCVVAYGLFWAARLKKAQRVAALAPA